MKTKTVTLVIAQITRGIARELRVNIMPKTISIDKTREPTEAVIDSGEMVIEK